MKNTQTRKLPKVGHISRINDSVERYGLNALGGFFSNYLDGRSAWRWAFSLCVLTVTLVSFSFVNIAVAAWSDDPMLHNSNRFTGTTKHGGGWGLPSEYAGGIECVTCHVKGSTNIKRIKTTISYPDGSTMPSGGASTSVIFTNAEDGTSNFGDDSTAPRATSNKVCEVCHTYDAVQAVGTDVHASDQQVTTDHYDQADCVKCHEHKLGFAASCDACHASPPLDAGGLVTTDPTGSSTHGEHQKHAIDLGYGCNTCHNGWDGSGQMPNGGDLNIGFDTPYTDGGSYEGRPSASGSYTENAATGTTVTQDTVATDMSCSVYCHGADAPVWNPSSTAPCGSCHGDPAQAAGNNTDGAPTGDGGSRDLSGDTAGFEVGKHANHLDDSFSETGDYCSLCHPGGEGHVGGGIDGTVQVTIDTTAAGGTASYTPDAGGAGTAGTCNNMSCHGDASWDSSVTGGCDFCHGYPPNTTNNKHASGVRAFNHSTELITAHNNGCQYCHGFEDGGSGEDYIGQATMKGGYQTVAGDHKDGKTTMNGDAGGDVATTRDDAEYKLISGSNYGCATAACHSNDASHQLTVTGTMNVQLREIGPGDCAMCHVSGSPLVASTPQIPTTGHGSLGAGDCTACHVGHTTHNTAASLGGVVIPNNAIVGIDYDNTIQNGHNGVMLGGRWTDSTISGLSVEAEMCWACHDAQSPKISEWGTNSQTNGLAAGRNYDFGEVYTDSSMSTTTSKWLGTYWQSANFTYKNGYLNNKPTTADPVNGTANAGSTHAANSTDGVSGVDNVGDIRCSYCHNVHVGTVGDGSTVGKPYLRGTWKGNPYYEDGAPRAGVVFTDGNRYDLVPRGSASTTRDIGKGGYWIDQNSAYPTNDGTAPTKAGSVWTWSDAQRWTLANSAGLCTSCHGSNVNTMNEFGTASDDWVGTNGHSNAVLGGDGTGRSNIYSEGGATYGRKPNDGFCSTTTTDGACSDYPNMGYRQYAMTDSGSEAYGLRGNYVEAEGWGVNPRMIANRPRAWQDFSWGVTIDNNTAETQYHCFSCSKCHNPHASRLPRLMITNCLDTKNNTWDDGPPKGAAPGETITLTACSDNNLEQTYTVAFFDGSRGNDYDVGYALNGTGYTNTDRTQDSCTVEFSSAPGVTYSNVGVSLYDNDAANNNDLLELEATDDAVSNQISFAPGWRAQSTDAETMSNNVTWTSQDNEESHTSNLTSAQNCHRVADTVESPNAKGSGWNNVTPW